MKTEKLLSNIKELPGLKLQCVLFEGQYPLAFTCVDSEDKVYFFICYQVNTEAICFIVSETSYNILIDMLEDKITLREAFLAVSEKKYRIKFHGDYEDIIVEAVNRNQLEDAILPTEGEYMEVEGDEFADEIALFREEMNYKQINYTFAANLYQCIFEGKAIVTVTSNNLNSVYNRYKIAAEKETYEIPVGRFQQKLELCIRG